MKPVSGIVIKTLLQFCRNPGLKGKTWFRTHVGVCMALAENTLKHLIFSWVQVAALHRWYAVLSKDTFDLSCSNSFYMCINLHTLWIWIAAQPNLGLKKEEKMPDANKEIHKTLTLFCHLEITQCFAKQLYILQFLAGIRQHTINGSLQFYQLFLEAFHPDCFSKSSSCI